MPSANEYDRKVSDIWSKSWKTWGDPEENLVLVRQAQKELRIVKREIAATIKELRLPFADQKAKVQPGLFDFSQGDKRASVANQRDAIHQKELAAIKPYQAVVLRIDKALVELDKKKLEFESKVGKK